MTTGIVHVRLSGERDDLTRLAAAISALPGLTVTALRVRQNYRDPGMRGYLTVAISQDAEREDSHAKPDA